jgi:hypothetical protein
MSIHNDTWTCGLAFLDKIQIRLISFGRMVGWQIVVVKASSTVSGAMFNLSSYSLSRSSLKLLALTAKQIVHGAGRIMDVSNGWSFVGSSFIYKCQDRFLCRVIELTRHVICQIKKSSKMPFSKLFQGFFVRCLVHG